MYARPNKILTVLARAAVVAVLLAVTALLPSEGHAQEAERPEYSDLRHEEDWWDAVLPEEGGDFYDPIKRIRFTSDGEVWLGMGGEIRLRAQGWSDYRFASPEENDAVYGLGRARFHLDFWATRMFRIFVEGGTQLASKRQLPGEKRPRDHDPGTLNQAFVDLTAPFSDETSVTLRVGKQEMAYGARRLVSPSDWFNVRQGFYAARLIAHLAGARLEGFYARPVDLKPYQFNDWRDDAEFIGFHSRVPVSFSEYIEGAEVYWFWQHEDESTWLGVSGEEDRHVVGFRLDGQLPTGWYYDVEGGYQFGEHADRAIEAGFFAGHLGLLLEQLRFDPRLSLGLDYGSGDQDGTDEVLETFSQMYGDQHQSFGITDMVGRQNGLSFSAMVGFEPLNGLVFMAEGFIHHLAEGTDKLYDESGDPIRAARNEAPDFVGFELNVGVDYQIGRHSTFTGRYGHFFARDTIAATGKFKDVDAGYVEYRFVF